MGLTSGPNKVREAIAVKLVKLSLDSFMTLEKF